LLEGIPEPALRDLEEKCRWLEFSPEQTVLEREDDTHEMFFIARGSVRVMNYLGDEREVALADLGAGEHFGELSAVDCRERAARVVSTGNAIIAALSHDHFIATLLAYPHVALRLLDHFAAVIRAMNERVSALSTLTPRQRVYLELLRMAEPNPKGDGSWLIDIVPNHNEIASWAGTERQEVAVAIGALVRDGILERKHKSFLIKDHSRLRRLADM
jgi:CRP-like cAMP-binding protein